MGYVFVPGLFSNVRTIISSFPTILELLEYCEVMTSLFSRLGAKPRAKSVSKPFEIENDFSICFDTKTKTNKQSKIYRGVAVFHSNLYLQGVYSLTACVFRVTKDQLVNKDQTASLVYL